MSITSKDFLGLKEVDADVINTILSTTSTMKFLLGQKNKKTPHLQGRTIVMLFYEKSARTRLSYELAAQYLSATVVDLQPVDSAVSRQDNIQQLGHMADQMGADFIVLRHPTAGSARILANSVQASVINAGDGRNENPSQALLDLYTIKEKKGSFSGLKVAMIGDVLNSRVAKSNIWALIKLGADVHIAAPPTLIPPNIEDFGAKVSYNVKDAVHNADVVLALRTQLTDTEHLIPSLNEYKRYFEISTDVMRLAKPDAVVMHPGAINRGIEISSEIIDGQQCLVNDQILNGVAVRMALLYLLSLGGGAEHGLTKHL